MGDKITAVIPIRKGSTRVRHKNLRSFGNTNLLELKIETLKKVAEIDEIIVNTDSDEAIEIAKKYNVKFHKREAYFASSECSNSEFLKHLGETTQTDIFAYCPVTSPFISAETIRKCIQKFTNSTNDSLATATVVREFLWLDNKPINYKTANQPNSQDLPNILALNFGLNLIRRNDLIKFRNIVGKNPLFVELNEIEGMDIDTPFDFFIAEQYYLSVILNKKPLLD